MFFTIIQWEKLLSIGDWTKLYMLPHVPINKVVNQIFTNENVLRENKVELYLIAYRISNRIHHK